MLGASYWQQHLFSSSFPQLANWPHGLLVTKTPLIWRLVAANHPCLPFKIKDTTLEAASVINTGGFFNKFMVLNEYTNAVWSMSVIDGLQLSLGLFS
jgi:hypothetical protein